MTDASLKTVEIDPYAALQDKEPPRAPRNQWLDVWDQFKKHKGAVFGWWFFVVYHTCRPARPIHMECRPTKTRYPQQRCAANLDLDLGWFCKNTLAPPLLVPTIWAETSFPT